jgi:S-adenosylmethionine:diacylglycerol 3-amino-3-carboxypropyl transferase
MFALVFHPFVYRKRGIDPAGLTHAGARNIGRFFYQRFRSFCCSTPARRNFYLQQTFFNRVLFPEAMPEYLQPAHRETLVGNADRIQYRLGSIVDVLQHSATGQYNKIHLSNIGDWISSAAMADLFRLLRDKTRPGAKVVVRYIHRHHRVPASVPELVADPGFGEQLVRTDRYPFYSVIPMVRV